METYQKPEMELIELGDVIVASDSSCTNEQYTTCCSAMNYVIELPELP